MSYRICRPTPPILWFYPRAYNRRSTAYWPHWRLTSRRVLRHPQLRKYHYPQPLSWPSNDCYSLVQVLKDISVVRLCSLRPRAESVTYLLYRYSVVKYQWGIFCSSPIPMKSGFRDLFFEKKLKIFSNHVLPTLYRFSFELTGGFLERLYGRNLLLQRLHRYSFRTFWT